MPGSADIWAMRPKLRHDVVFLETPTGAYLRGADEAFLLKGRSAFRWLSTLSPYLTGEHTLDQLCASLDPGQRNTVATLVGALAARGFVRNVSDRTALPEPVANRFANQVGFLAHFVDDAAERFMRFHRARVVLGGTGPALLAAATGLVRNGCATVDVRPEDDPEPYRRALQAEVEELRASQVDVEVRVDGAPIAGTETDVDAIVYCAEAPQLPRLLELARRCHDRGPLLVPVVWSSQRAIVGPISGLGTVPCWLCAQLRLAANADPAVAAESWRHLALGPVAAAPVPAEPVATQMIGNAAAFELFRALTGALPPETGSAVVVLDLDTLESTRERLLRHPQCPVCRGTAGDPPAPMPDQLTDEEAYQRAEVLVSPNVGVFTQFVDDPLEQAPLKTARLRVPGTVGAESAREITAFDVHTVLSARLRAYRIAVGEYASRLAEPDGTVVASAAELIEDGRTPVPWDELATASGAVPYTPERRLAWLPATVLDTEQTVWVPAAFALPLSPANRDGYAERTLAGIVAAPTSGTMVLDGLVSALAYESMSALLRGRAAIAPVTEDELVRDEDTALVVKAAHRFGRRLRVFTVATAPAHVALAVEDEPAGRPAWAVGAGTSARQARLAALRDLVGILQVRHFEGGAPDLGHPMLADFDPRTVPTDSPSPAVAASGESTLADMLSTLADRGLTALLVDITTSDIRSTGAMTVGAVLLRRRPESAPH
ncbi:MAG TPA: TOMM precursor leader peptide-binding protein [Micromonosporaceae bacterium]